MGVMQMENDTWQLHAEFTVESKPGNEQLVMAKVAAVVESLNLSPQLVERLKTAVTEATLNAMEHGNGYRAEHLVAIQVLSSSTALKIRVTDCGHGPATPVEEPDIHAKLARQQSPRGWGYFLIQNMVDEVREEKSEDEHTLVLTFWIGKNGT